MNALPRDDGSPNTSRRWIPLVLVGLVVALLLGLVFYPSMPAPDPLAVNPVPAAPATAAQDYDRDRLVPSDEATRAVAADTETGEGIGQLPDDYVDRDDRGADGSRAPGADGVRGGPGVDDGSKLANATALGDKPNAADLPAADIGADAPRAGIGDEVFRSAVNAWTGPEQCARQVRGDGTSSVRVEIDFAAGGAARAVRGVDADSVSERAYVDCLDARVTGLDLDAEVPGGGSRIATLLF